MDGYYTSYSCKGCNKDIILITEEVKRTLASGKYVSCSHCGCKKLIKIKTTDDLRECMKHGSYKRAHGALRQVIHE
jgi:DNA-directed RNA polymerase subunit RPC12/RpoP